MRECLRSAASPSFSTNCDSELAGLFQRITEVPMSRTEPQTPKSHQPGYRGTQPKGLEGKNVKGDLSFCLAVTQSSHSLSRSGSHSRVSGSE